MPKLTKMKAKDFIWYPFAGNATKTLYVFTCDYTIKRLSFIIVLFENNILSKLLRMLHIGNETHSF